MRATPTLLLPLLFTTPLATLLAMLLALTACDKTQPAMPIGIKTGLAEGESLRALTAASDATSDQATLSDAGSDQATLIAPDAKLAKVNDTIITGVDLERHMTPLMARFAVTGQPVPSDRLAELREQVLDKLIEQELLYQASDKAGISVDQTTVETEFTTMKSRFPSEAEFTMALKRMELTTRELKDQMQRSMTIKKLLDKKLGASVTVSQQDLRAYYDQHPDKFNRPERLRASHILIKVDNRLDKAKKAAARVKIEQAQAQLKGGKDFAALAREISQCPSAAKGGDLGSFSSGTMVPAFEQAALALKPGQISDVIQTEFGFHLIKLTEKQPGSTVTFEKARGRIEPMLKQQKVQEALQAYIDTLKQGATITTSL